jgi:CheY-like chemotaxis protein
MQKLIEKSAEVKKVLIVDDYEFTCRMVALYFAEFGYDADFAVTAAEGLKLALQNKYEVILVDLCLPDDVGLELVKKLRQHESFDATKIIIFTGNDCENINYYKRYGVDGLLLKPCTFATVREALGSCLIKLRSAWAN